MMISCQLYVLNKNHIIYIMNKYALFIWIPKCAGSSVTRQLKLNAQIGNNPFVYNFTPLNI